MSIEQRIREERERLPQIADWTPREGQLLTEFAEESEGEGKQFLAYLPTTSPTLVAAWQDAQYGEFRSVDLGSRDVTVFAFESAEQRDQFVADTGASDIRDTL